MAARKKPQKLPALARTIALLNTARDQALWAFNQQGELHIEGLKQLVAYIGAASVNADEALREALEGINERI